MFYKKSLIHIILGVFGGLVAAVFVWPVLVRTNFLNSAALLSRFSGEPQIITQIEKQTIIAPQSGFSEAIKRVTDSVVAVQSFDAGRLIRSGSGVILTQDGLIITLNTLVPTNASVVQAVRGNKIYNARVMSRDYTNNLAIITITETGLPVVSLKEDMPGLADNLLIFSKNANFGKEYPLVGSALVFQTSAEGNSFQITAGFGSEFYGGALINNSAEVLGIINFKSQKPQVVTAKTIKTFLNSSLTLR